MSQQAPKRILVFSLAYEPFIGGVETALREIISRIPPDEIEFHILTLRIDSRLPRNERIGNAVVHRIGFSIRGAKAPDLTRFPLRLNLYWYQLAAGFVALRLHGRYQFDAVWAMMAHTAGIPAGLFKAFRPKVPYLLTLQEGDPPPYIERLMRPVFPLFKRGFTSADELQAISTFLLSWGKRMGFPGQGALIPNGVDLPRFSVEPVPHEGTVLVTTSRLVRKNAVDDVIRALPALPDEISFHIYGLGPEEQALRALAQELGVTERTRFMGEISHADMPGMLAACDIFIRPSRSEGQGASFIEAMAAGLPIIATQEGGLSDFIFDAKRNPDKEATAWAVDKDCPEQIAAAVKDILAHPKETAATVARAKKLVLEGYDWDLVASRMKALFDRLLSGGSI